MPKIGILDQWVRSSARRRSGEKWRRWFHLETGPSITITITTLGEDDVEKLSSSFGIASLHLLTELQKAGRSDGIKGGGSLEEAADSAGLGANDAVRFHSSRSPHHHHFPFLRLLQSFLSSQSEPSQIRDLEVARSAEGRRRVEESESRNRGDAPFFF